MMSDFDDIDGDLVGEPASPASKAFDTSGAHVFKGEKLKPFSGLRMRLAELLHLRFFSALQRAAVDSEAMDQLKLGRYDGQQHDTAVVLYLCSKPRSGIEYGFVKPSQLLREINDWADKSGIYRGTDAYEEGAEIVLKILFEIINVLPGDDSPKSEAEDGGAKKKS